MKISAGKAYIQLAELIRANISGPVKRDLIEKAQRKLVKRLENAALVTSSEANELLV